VFVCERRVLEVRLLSMRCVLQSLYPVVECARVCGMNFVGLTGQCALLLLLVFFFFSTGKFLELGCVGLYLSYLRLFGRIRERVNFLVEIGIMKGLSLRYRCF
jgi:hypothetical protein